jgi:Holliday junction resolvase RusA-like endonuclease
MKLVVDMPYFGTLSVNSYKIGRTKATRPEVKVWMQILANKVRSELNGRTFITPGIITVDGYFHTDQYPDLDNLAKVVMDGIKVGLGIDDKYLRFKSGEINTGYWSQYLRITISDKEVDH